MEYNKFLYDEFGNIYERKNLYLKEIVELNEKIKEVNPNEKNYLRRQQKELIKKRGEHPYNIKFKKFKESEKNFIKSLKKKKKDFINQLDQSLPYKVKKLKIECFIAQEKYNFYKKYIDLTYDAQFEYEKNRILMKELPPIIESIVKETKAVQNAIKDRKNIDLNQEKKIELEFKKFEKEQKKALKLEQRKLKEKRKKG